MKIISPMTIIAVTYILFMQNAYAEGRNIEKETVTCEIRPNCTITETFFPNPDFVRPPCEMVLNGIQLDGGSCITGKLNGVVRKTYYSENNKADLVYIQKYADGIQQSERNTFFIRYQAGKVIAEQYGTGMSPICGNIGSFNPPPENREVCEGVRVMYGEEAFLKQPPFKRTHFKVQLVSATATNSASSVVANRNELKKDDCDTQLAEHKRKWDKKIYDSGRDAELKEIEMYSGVCADKPGADKLLTLAKARLEYRNNGFKNKYELAAEAAKSSSTSQNDSAKKSAETQCLDIRRAITARYPEVFSIPGSQERLIAYESGPCANEADAEMQIANSKRILAIGGVSASSGISSANRRDNNSTATSSCRQKIVAIQTKGDADSRAAGGDAIMQAKAMYNASAAQEALFSGECASDPQASSYVSSARSAMRDWGSKCQQFGGDASCGGSSVAIAAAAKASAARTAAQKQNSVPLYRDPPIQEDNEAFARRTNAARDCSRRPVKPQERGISIDGWDCETPAKPAVSAKLTQDQCVNEQSRIKSIYAGDGPGRARAELELFQGRCAHIPEAQIRVRQMKDYLASLNARPISTPSSPSGTSSSGGIQRPDRFGALAIDYAHGTLSGWAYDYASQSEADNRAENECAQKSASCTIVFRFKNTCAAYAIDPANESTAYGWAYSAQRGDAETAALGYCRQRGGDSAQCSIRVWGCTTR